MDPPDAFGTLCQGLHQGVHEAAATPEGLAAYCLDFVRSERRAELKAFVEAALRRRTNAELKGLIRRTQADLLFTSAGARAFLEAVLAKLEEGDALAERSGWRSRLGAMKGTIKVQPGYDLTEPANPDWGKLYE